MENRGFAKGERDNQPAIMTFFIMHARYHHAVTYPSSSNRRKHAQKLAECKFKIGEEEEGEGTPDCRCNCAVRFYSPATSCLRGESLSETLIKSEGDILCF